jgi:antitoxin CptB
MSQDLEMRRRRAVYRATHRGTKEMDWMIGRFADANAPSMDAAALGRFERLLAMTDPDLNGWIFAPETIGDSEFSADIAAIRAFHGLAP